jgi:hypothetical protein
MALAIELAAARVPSLGLDGIEAGLADRLRLCPAHNFGLRSTEGKRQAAQVDYGNARNAQRLCGLLFGGRTRRYLDVDAIGLKARSGQ